MLELHKYEEEIKNISDCANKEMAIEKVLDEISSTWENMKFNTEKHHSRPNVEILRIPENFIEILDDNRMQLQNIVPNESEHFYLAKINQWQSLLTKMDMFVNIWFDVQQKWIYLENIFIGSADIRSQLNEEAERFDEIDGNFQSLIHQITAVETAVEIVSNHEEMFGTLRALQQRLAISERALNEYLETKRLAFPRFYFLSSADLLSILSNGNKPQLIDRHLIKLFDSISALKYIPKSTKAFGMVSKDNDEFVPFKSEFIECLGMVETWLSILVDEMRLTLHNLFGEALSSFSLYNKEKWILDWPAQVALCINQISWTAEVHSAFIKIEEGYESAMRDLHKQQIHQLNILINLLLSDLKPGDRQKIMTICTIDVHSRDVIGKIIQNEVDHSSAFSWQSQLRHRWAQNHRRSSNRTTNEYDCFANICDAEFRYAYEYLGNTSRLVITPLTDRCYITLTQVIFCNYRYI